MAADHQLLISASDAGALAMMLGRRGRGQVLEPAAASALAELLGEALFVADETLPADRVAMNSRVTYEQLPGGDRRSVSLVYPVDAHAAAGCVSVLSPLGLSLLGRAAGVAVDLPMPRGCRLRIRIAAVEQNGGGPSSTP